jgi:hypothetical protein
LGRVAKSSGAAPSSSSTALVRHAAAISSRASATPVPRRIRHGGDLDRLHRWPAARTSWTSGGCARRSARPRSRDDTRQQPRSQPSRRTARTTALCSVAAAPGKDSAQCARWTSAAWHRRGLPNATARRSPFTGVARYGGRPITGTALLAAATSTEAARPSKTRRSGLHARAATAHEKG